MQNEEFKQDPKNIENLKGEYIDGKNVLAGGPGDISGGDLHGTEMAGGNLELTLESVDMGGNLDVVPFDAAVDVINNDMPILDQPVLQTPIGGHKGPGVI